MLSAPPPGASPSTMNSQAIGAMMGAAPGAMATQYRSSYATPSSYMIPSSVNVPKTYRSLQQDPLHPLQMARALAHIG